MKKHLKTVFLIFGIFAILYSLNNDYSYAYTLLSALLCGILIPNFLIIKRNLKLSTPFFKYRFYWIYPMILFFSLSLFVTFKLLLTDEGAIDLILFLILLTTSLIIGLIWGVKERTKLKDQLVRSEYVEYVDLMNEEFDREKEGVLSLEPNLELSFVEKGKELFRFKKSEIHNVTINLEYRLFPTHLTIELKNGTRYLLDSEYPFVWKRELTKL